MSSAELESAEHGSLSQPDGSSSPADVAGDRVCANCGSGLAADQRYCLSCGEPVAPLRLGFLDALQDEYAGSAPAASGPARPGDRGRSGSLGLLQRYSGPLALLAIVLLAVVIGLLIGHWTTATKTPVKSVISVKGLAEPQTGAAAGGGTSSGATKGTSSGATKSPSSHGQAGSTTTGGKGSTTGGKGGSASGSKTQPKATEGKAKAGSSTSSKLNIERLSKSTGKTHAREIEEAIQSGKPITG